MHLVARRCLPPLRREELIVQVERVRRMQLKPGGALVEVVAEGDGALDVGGETSVVTEEVVERLRGQRVEGGLAVFTAPHQRRRVWPCVGDGLELGEEAAVLLVEVLV